MANRIKILRTKSDDAGTVGVLTVEASSGREIWSCATLELPWRGNDRRVSCIPPGRYIVAPRTSERFKKHLHIVDVPGRDWILIHPANYVSELAGCIAVGLKSFEGPEGPWVEDSRIAMGELLELITRTTEIIIEEAK